MRKHIAHEELLQLKFETRRTELTLKAAELQLRAAHCNLQKAQDEAELASLKLDLFKKEVNFKVLFITIFSI